MVFHLVIDASLHERNCEEKEVIFPPIDLRSDDIISLGRALLTRRIFFKEDQISLTVVGSDVSGNSMSYENVSHFGLASHEDHLEYLRRVEEPDGCRQIGDLFEGFIVALDQALKATTTDSLEEIHIIGTNMSRWEADEGSSESVRNSILRNKEKLRITFIGPPPCPFALWADTPHVLISPPDLQTDSRIPPPPPPPSVYQYLEPSEWCSIHLLKPGVKSVKAVTTCRVGLDFCNGGFQVPGYMYISCKENPLPSMKKGEPLPEGSSSIGLDHHPVIMNRIQYTQNDEGIEEELGGGEGEEEEEEIVTAYIYGNRYIPINSIDRNLIELPAEEKSLKVLDVVEESIYETYFIHGQTSLFVPDPIIGSYQAMEGLCRSLKRQKLGLVTRLKARANHSPKLMLMLPANRKEEKPKALSWCLTMNNLTYAADVRRHNFVAGRRSISSEKLNLAYDLVKRNSLDPARLLRWNPAYRRLLTVLVAKSYSQETDFEEVCDWIEKESLKLEPPVLDGKLKIPARTAELFGITLKVTRTEDRLRTWKKATQINLTDMFPDVIVIDRSDPIRSLDESMKEHAKETLTLIKIVTIFGDLVNESLVTDRGRKFPELLQALKDATLRTLGESARTETSEEIANLVEAYNQIVMEAISIVKLDRQVFVDIEPTLKPPIFILDSEANAGRSVADAERIIQSIQEAPAKQVDLPTPDTGVPVTQPDFRDEEFDDLE